MIECFFSVLGCCFFSFLCCSCFFFSVLSAQQFFGADCGAAGFRGRFLSGRLYGISAFLIECYCRCPRELACRAFTREREAGLEVAACFFSGAFP